jgi:hypothetical protein
MVVVSLSGCSVPAPVYGLRPEYPSAHLDIMSTPPAVAFVEVDTLQPTLRWEPFPNMEDRENDRNGRLTVIRDVTYDLKILGTERDYPTKVLYARSDLREPSHRVEMPLLPEAKYFWTVRARFTLDGVTRVTPWSQILGGYSSEVVVPSRYYFGLKTPSR